MPTLQITMVEISAGRIPAELTGVRWSDGTVECRFRLTHPHGSLVASDDDIGEVLIDPSAVCDNCSEACD